MDQFVRSFYTSVIRCFGKNDLHDEVNISLISE